MVHLVADFPFKYRSAKLPVLITDVALINLRVIFDLN
jgi:hypothetical protein